MGFISFPFLIFITLSTLLYFIFPVNSRWKVLLLASVLFYAIYGLRSFPFIIITSIISYYSALKIGEIYKEQNGILSDINLSKEQRKNIISSDKAKCRKILIIAVTLVLAMLIYTKTARWIIDNIISVFTNTDITYSSIIIPLGISYYTFSVIGYMADVYWKKEEPEKNYFKFALFVFYFPKILQGPISRHKNLAHQLLEGHTFDYTRFCYGIQLMLWGYFKKLVIADRLAIVVNKVFTNYTNYSGSILLLSAAFATIELYCDFSACMDIASGISQVFGIQLEKNFDHPFFSKSAAEFWRRWHITLGAWFKDYVYMPIVISPKLLKVVQQVKKKLGARAGKTVMTAIPLFVVWLLTGVWHGTGWSYVVWGVYWGALIILSSSFEPEIKKLNKVLHINTQTDSWKLFQMVRTFLLFCIGRMITIPNNLRITIQLFQKVLFHYGIWELFDGTLLKIGLDAPNFVLAVLSIFLLWAVGNLQKYGSIREKIGSYNIAFRWLIYYGAIFAVLIFGIYGPGYEASSFIYMNY